MSVEEIIGEIGQLREGIDISSRRITELSRSLYDRMRRNDRYRVATNGERNDATNIYTTYANLWLRFGGIVQQGLQRTRQADRILRLLPEEETPRRVAQDANPPPAPMQEAQTVPASSPFEDFITVYGEEMMRDASPADGQRER
jgi:hypothetical protein